MTRLDRFYAIKSSFPDFIVVVVEPAAAYAVRALCCRWAVGNWGELSPAVYPIVLW